MATAQEGPDTLSPEFAANPYPVYRAMRAPAPLLLHEAVQSQHFTWSSMSTHNVRRPGTGPPAIRDMSSRPLCTW